MARGSQEQVGGASVTPLVRRVLQSVSLARTAEALMLGSGLALLTLSAAIVSGSDLEASIVVLAGLTGALFGCSWFVEMRPELGDVVQTVDQNLRLDGSMVAALEAEQQVQQSPLARLLSHRLRERVRTTTAIKAALPTSVPFLAAPLLGATVLFSVREAQIEQVDPTAWLNPMAIGAAEELREAMHAGSRALQDEGLDQEDVTRMAEMESRIQTIAADSRGGGLTEQELDRIAGEIEEVLQELEVELGGERGMGQAEHQVRNSLEVAATHLESVLDRLDDQGVSPPSMGEGSPEGAQGSASEPGAGASPESATGGPDGATGDASAAAAAGGMGEGSEDKSVGGLASGGEEGTMSGPPPAADGGNPDMTPAQNDLPVRGIATHPWWPRRHSDLVGLWIEASRNQSSGRSGGAQAGQGQDEQD